MSIKNQIKDTIIKMCSFRQNLQSEMEYQGISQKELAAMTGIPASSISHYLNKNECIPAADNAVSIAKALGVTVEALILSSSPAQNLENTIHSKYTELIEDLEILGDEQARTFIQSIHLLAEAERKNRRNAKTKNGEA
jgi:transcriptional regulator with XRE-family HTH domain